MTSNVALARKTKDTLSRIAIFRALHLGDMLLAIPAIRAVRKHFPNAEITLITLPWAQQLEVRFPNYLDRVIEFPGFPGIREVPYRPDKTEPFLANQRDYGYDLAIQL